MAFPLYEFGLSFFKIVLPNSFVNKSYLLLPSKILRFILQGSFFFILSITFIIAVIGSITFTKLVLVTLCTFFKSRIGSIS